MAESFEADAGSSTAEEAAYLRMTSSRREAGLKRIACELEELLAKPPDQCTAGPVDAGNLYRWQATIEGPQGSPYEGGLFKLRILLPREYPFEAPVVNFITSIYHPNISSTGGDICLDLLKCRWSPSLSIGKVLVAIRSLMCNPNPDDPLECIAAAEYKNNREQYISTAKMWTTAFAKE